MSENVKFGKRSDGERQRRELVLKVRMSEDEMRTLDDCAIACGLGEVAGDYRRAYRSEFVRGLIETFSEHGGEDWAAKRIEKMTELRDEVQAIVDAINKAGNNVNQIAADVNRRHKEGNKEPLNLDSWKLLFKRLGELEQELIAANKFLLENRGVSGVPANYEGRG